LLVVFLLVPVVFIVANLAVGFEAGLEEGFFTGAFLAAPAFAALAFAGADVPVVAFLAAPRLEVVVTFFVVVDLDLVGTAFFA